MSEQFRGVVNLDIRESSPDWAPFAKPTAPPGTPDVVYVVLDDVGFGALGCYEGLIDTPNTDRIAAAGLRYTQWHTTAHYVTTFAGVTEQRVDGTEDLPTGDAQVLSASSSTTGEDPPSTVHGTLSLFHGDRQVAEGAVDVSGAPYLDLEREAAAMPSRE